MLDASVRGCWPSWPPVELIAVILGSGFGPHLAGRMSFSRVSRSHPQRLARGEGGLPVAAINGGGKALKDAIPSCRARQEGTR